MEFIQSTIHRESLRVEISYWVSEAKNSRQNSVYSNNMYLLLYYICKEMFESLDDMVNPY